jgi:chromosome segregation ATPase
MPDGNGSRDWREEMRERMEALEKAHKELEDSFIVLTHVETKMSQLLKDQTEYVANHEQLLRQHEDRLQDYEKRRQEQAERDRMLDERIDKLVLAIGDLIRRIPPQNLR